MRDYSKLLMRTYCWIFLVSLTSACDVMQDEMDWYVKSGQTMGTSYTVKARFAPTNLSSQALEKEITVTLDLANQVLSNWVAGSEVSEFNASTSTDWQAVSTHFYAVMKAAENINHLSEGQFDITLSPLINLWGFGPKGDAEPPAESQIKLALQSTGQRSLLALKERPPAIRKLNSAVTINLSAIAKGYAVDMIAARLDHRELKDYLVEIGGDLYTRGVNEQGQLWRVGIERPESGGRSVQKIVAVNNMGLATSGDYRKYKNIQGKRLSHIIDPSTGYPVTHDLASVTVLASSTMHADALATALLVMGAEKGLALAEQQKLAAFFIRRKEKHFETSSSSAFKAAYTDKPLE